MGESTTAGGRLMEPAANLRLVLSNKPECAALVRATLAGVADAVGLDALSRNDLDTAVGEVCKNVIYHAYEGFEGPLELELHAHSGPLVAVVRDHGIGIRPQVGERTLPHTGLGMPVSHMLTHRITYTNVHGGGTEVRLEFPFAPALPLPAPPPTPPLAPDRPPEAGDRVELSLASPALARAVLPRLLVALAEQAGFPTGRSAELGGLGARIAEMAPPEAELRIAASAPPAALELDLELEEALASAVLDEHGSLVERVEGLPAHLRVRRDPQQQ